MTPPFVLDDVLARFARSVSGPLDAQRADGAVVRADWGLDDPGGTCSLVAVCAFAEALRRAHPGPMAAAPPEPVLRDAVARALDSLEAYQRPSGLTDLRDCNFDSSPDAGFILQALCPAVAAWRDHGGDDPNWRPLTERLDAFLRRMMAGTLDGGFHTPNHRWVIASGLAQAARLYPDLDVRPTVDAYLAEGIDLDPDGFYLERSAGVYDAICDRSLLLLDQAMGCPEARDAALANLRANRFLLEADGTVETGLSRRQDYGTRNVPAGLIAPYLLGGLVADDPELVGIAAFLWEKSGGGDPYGVAQVLLAHGSPSTVGAPPERYERYFPVNALWRERRGPRTASVFGGQTRLLAVRNGRAELSAVKIHQAYFGVGRFVGERMAVRDGGATLFFDADSHPRRPGYEMPLGRPVPWDRYADMRAERPIRRLPPCSGILEVDAVDDGYRLRYVAAEGMDRVPAQIAFDFAPGGVWETDDTCFEPRAGQVLFLKSGRGAMRYGRDVLEIGPGADAHRMAFMRDSEAAPDRVRVLLTFLAPVDHTVHIRCFRREP